MRSLACLPVLALVLAGCSGTPVATEAGGTQDDQQGQLDVDIVDDETPQATTGRVEGVVLHPSGFPLKDVEVTILSLDNASTTRSDGTFSFRSVPPGQQTLRVEKETFATLQKPITVVAGKISRLEIVMSPAEDVGFTQHLHDHWRGADTYTVFDDVLEWPDQLAPRCILLVQEEESCWQIYAHPEKGRIVPPGTGSLTFTIKVELPPTGPAEIVTFYAISPPDSGGKAWQVRQVIEKDETVIEYELPKPDIVDHGHATWTDWQFYVSWSSYQSIATAGMWDALMRSDIELSVIAHKDTLEVDPPHPRSWAEAGRFNITGFTEPASASCLATEHYCTERDPSPSVTTASSGNTYCYYACMSLAPGNIVPPGATRIQFTIEHYWSGASAAQAGSLYERPGFIIGYVGPLTQHGQATWEDYEWIEPVATATTERGEAWTYELEVGDQFDPYYQKQTRWIFHTAVRGHEQDPTYSAIDCPSLACGAAYFELTEFWVINDDWAEA